MGTKFLIDTNVIIDFQMNSIPENGMSFLTKVIDEDFTISFVSYIEFLGYKNASKTSEEFMSLANVIQINASIINTCISIRKAHKIKLPDAIIAATAIANKLTLITCNAKDFENVKNLKVLNPYTLTI